jgi:type I restriction enzyme M protein
MIYHLDDNGTMAVVLPHGVLFRGGAEGAIRQYLIEEKNYLDAVIGLPANVFYGTTIPTCILVFKKCRQDDNTVLFIDASNDFEKAKNQNNLTDKHVKKIVSAYEKRETVDKYSYVATLDEIKENEYNLNIPRYVDTFEEEEQISLDEVATAIQQTQKEIMQAEKELFALFGELHGTNDDVDRELQNALAKLMNVGDGNE